MTESDPQAVEDAVKYIMFLVDPDKLFDIALGMYDFSLVLLIAQSSQKVESNPIRSLHLTECRTRTLENIYHSSENYGLWRNRIDITVLTTTSNATRVPSRVYGKEVISCVKRMSPLFLFTVIGSKYFEEATKYVEKHRLYKNALQLWKDSPHEYAVRISI